MKTAKRITSSTCAAMLVASSLANPVLAAQQTLAQTQEPATTPAPTAANTAKLDDTAEMESVRVQDNNFGITLFRIINGTMVTPGYELYEGKEGNEIGLLPMGSHTIADVEKTVSRRHLKIWKDEDGRWLAQGLRSKNGTIKIEAGTHEEVVIEHTRDFASDATPPIVEIEPGDHLILGQSTEFAVCRTLRN